MSKSFSGSDFQKIPKMGGDSCVVPSNFYLSVPKNTLPFCYPSLAFTGFCPISLEAGSKSTLTQLDWEIVVAQNYPIYVLCCKELQCILFHSDNQHADCIEEIKNICTLLTNMTIEIYIE